ncbi:VWA domain-containing protein [Actinosynnema sp. NPDC091369]
MPVIVLADVSGSMQGEKIAQLNSSIAMMFRTFAAEDSVRGQICAAVITFGGENAVLHQAMTPAGQLDWTDMVAGGRTPLGHALQLATSMLEDSEQVPVRAFPATLVLVSDGAPTDDWEEPLAVLLESRNGRSALRLSVGIGVDRTSEAQRVLESFSTPGKPVMTTERAHEIASNFRWVTATVTGQLHERTGQRAVQLEDLA